jgi:hypothetical protein
MPGDDLAVLRLSRIRACLQFSRFRSVGATCPIGELLLPTDPLGDCLIAELDAALARDDRVELRGLARSR